MSKDTNSQKIQLWVAIIGLIGVLGAALLGSWDKIFPVNEPAQPPEERGDTQSPPSLVNNQNEGPFEINMYYFLARKDTASSLAAFLTGQGYVVSSKPASLYTPLEKERNTPSYVFFNKSEYAKAMDIKLLIEKHIGHTMNAYRSDQTTRSRIITVVLTEAEK